MLSTCQRIAFAALLITSPTQAADRSGGPADSAVPLVLNLRIIEGEGAVHQIGSRSSTPLTVQVTDEVGRPVEGAAVSFLMPHDGPAGIFASGLSTEVLITGRDGRVTVRGIRWAREPGPVRIRITVMKGQARAGAISTQFLQAHSAEAKGPRKSAPSISKPRGKWIAIAVIAAGAAAGGLALGLSGSSSASAPTGALPPAASRQPPVQVGMPSITIGEP